MDRSGSEADSFGHEGSLRRTVSDPSSSPASSRSRQSSFSGGSSRAARASGEGSGRSIKEAKEWVIDAGDITFSVQLGQGGSGAVWRGEWKGIDVAVKLLYRQGRQVFAPSRDRRDTTTPLQKKIQNKMEKAFQAEVDTLSNLRHPHIVLFMGACCAEVPAHPGGSETQYGIVTEYLSGGSLYDHIHDNTKGKPWTGRASAKLVHRIAKDITLGMIYLHGEGVIHRDLKSRNILTDTNWNSKIADFDLARIRQTTLTKNDPSSSLVGTPSWMAPELIKGQRYDEKCDVYSFGMVLFELLSGEVPFSTIYGRDANHVRIVYDVVKNQRRPHLPEDLSSEAKELIARCWANDPSMRPSFADILALLNEASAASTLFCHQRNAHLAGQGALPVITETEPEAMLGNGAAGASSHGEIKRSKRGSFRRFKSRMAALFSKK